MKNITFYLVLLLSAMLVACSDDGGGSGSTASDPNAGGTLGGNCPDTYYEDQRLAQMLSRNQVDIQRLNQEYENSYSTGVNASSTASHCFHPYLWETFYAYIQNGSMPNPYDNEEDFLYPGQTLPGQEPNSW